MTGGLKTGKSTVAQMFVNLGAQLIDADKIVHQFLEPRGECLSEIRKIFGEAVINHQGGVDRKALAKIVFSDHQQLKKLEQIIHPKVRLEFKKRIEQIRQTNPDAVVVMDVPLLFESEIDWNVDLIVVVKATQEIQIKRAIKDLNISETQALQRIRSQLPMAEKVKKADIVIDNRLTKEETQKKVKQIWQKYQLNQKQ